MDPFDFLRISAISPRTSVADPRSNRIAIVDALNEHPSSDIVLFRNLRCADITCGDLFAHSVLHDQCLEELWNLVQASLQHPALIVVGLPFRHEQRLYNVAAAISQGTLLGLVPKQFLPNYQEFYERRWFVAADGSEPSSVFLEALGQIPFGTDLLFDCKAATIGIEICEDLWMPVPPSSLQAIQGANVLLNLSASNQTVGKGAYRTQLVTSQSGRCCAAYAYASSGPSESSTDLVFSGHCLIAENGTLLANRKGSGQDSLVRSRERQPRRCRSSATRSRSSDHEYVSRCPRAIRVARVPQSPV